MQKSFDKTQYHLMIKKTLQKEVTEGTYLNTIKAMHVKPTANIIVVKR